MALKKLSEEVQSLLQSSSQINSYKRAVEELIYNALDAEATSIAVRINIPESSIQVVDNGLGITRENMDNIGLKHMTSKCTNILTLKSIPNQYGYRGLALSSMVDVSQQMTITSRHNNNCTKETWIKTFSNGQEVDISKATDRSSKGTTVQIKGFLYNLTIQIKTLDFLQEIQDIKKFLELLSLVHNKISISLRNDATYEIILKIHKSRDIHQTLKTVFGIDGNSFQELTVEKHNYKVHAYIGKEIDHHNHWIYLNGRYLDYCKVHKVINEHLTKALHLKVQDKGKVKTRAQKFANDSDYHQSSHRKKIPFYLVLLTCPYDSYDLIQMPRKTLLEFHNWENVTKLLEKLVKFYVGDIKVKDLDVNEKAVDSVNKHIDTRDKVKSIMEKVLGSRSRIAVSQMKNSVKGKIAKRKKLKKDITSKINPQKSIPNNALTKILHSDTATVDFNKDNTHNESNKQQPNIRHSEKKDVKETLKRELRTCIRKANMNITYDNPVVIHTPSTNATVETEKRPHHDKNKQNNHYPSKTQNKRKRKIKRLKRKPHSFTPESKIQNDSNHLTMFFKNWTKTDDKIIKQHSQIENKQKSTRLVNTTKKLKEMSQEYTRELNDKKRYDTLAMPFNKPKNCVIPCKILSDHMKMLHYFYEKTAHRKMISEKAYFNKIKKNHENNYVRSKVGLNDFMSFSQALRRLSKLEVNINKCIGNNKESDFKSRGDLFHTVLKSQRGINMRFKFEYEQEYEYDNKILGDIDDVSVYTCNNFEKNTHTSQLQHFPVSKTFESHSYKYVENYTDSTRRTFGRHTLYNQEIMNNNLRSYKESRNKFITSVSRYNNIKKAVIRNKYNESIGSIHDKLLHDFSITKVFDTDVRKKSSYTIECADSSYCNNVDNNMFNGINCSLSNKNILLRNKQHDLNETFNKMSCNFPTHVEEINKFASHNINSSSFIGTFQEKSRYNNKCQDLEASDNINRCFMYDIVEEIQLTEITPQLLPMENCLNNNGSCTKEIPQIFMNELDEEISINEIVLNSEKDGINRCNNNNIVSEIERESIDPLNLCEVVMQSRDIFDTDSKDHSKTNSTNLNIKDSIEVDTPTKMDKANDVNIINENLNISFVNRNSNITLNNSDLNNIKEVECCNNIVVNNSLRPNTVDIITDTVFSESMVVNNNGFLDSSIKLIKESEIHDNTITINNAVISQDIPSENDNELIINSPKNHHQKDISIAIDNEIGDDSNIFNLKERLRFVPKGMSPIFTNCNTKNNILSEINNGNCDGCFNDSLYNEFENNVQIGTEVFEARLQNLKELTTKEINKVNHRIQKENASIVFDSASLKFAEVLGQVDNKFIAAKLTGNNVHTNETAKYLVLFDQHAVHERIRLERNLKDYMIENNWKPITLDSFILNLSSEEALVLHNYKEKFVQFGLEWNPLDDRKISINAIPEAILGKNIRKVELIINAVKNLIQEHVKAIKDQKGSLPLYPMTIMELVFSEACRYAIKFGDRLSKTDCSELLSSLHYCKVPFQCAHGRPVMTILLELKPVVHNYGVHLSKLRMFKKHTC